MRDLKVSDERAGEIAKRIGGYRNHGCMTYIKRDVADLIADREKLIEVIEAVLRLPHHRCSGYSRCCDHYVHARSLEHALEPLSTHQAGDQ